MKKPILIFLVLCNTILFANISLNKYGHINYSDEAEETDYFIENSEYYINIDEKTLIGNSLIEINNGYLTLTGEHDNIPTWLRVYSKNGKQLFHKEFNKVINISISENGKFAVFFNGNILQVLDIARLQLSSFERSIQFAVNNSGIPIFVDQDNKIHFQDQLLSVDENIHAALFQNKTPLIVTERSIYNIEKEPQKIYTFPENIFDAKIIENSLYLVIKNNSNYKLLKFNNSKNIEQIDEINFERSSNRIHEPIYAPLNYGEEDFPFPIGNSYAEIQQYGTTPYLHPGVDYMGDDFQEVYAVHDGFVKAVLTTGGAPYWRVAIANEDIPEETQGYLYAHLNQSSITVNYGDEVVAGDLLGTLYPWGYYDFTHIHFARVFCTGAQWYGDWWTTENNLLDVINIQDTIPPIFEDTFLGQRFAFRNIAGDYLDPLNLSSEFDIIVKCHDIANSDWRIDLHDLSYSLHPISNPDSTIFEQFSYVYDFDLDTYHSGIVDNMILNTIYSRDATCNSIGNYDFREYYHIITNSNGDSLITEEDAAESFDSSQFPDNYYYFKVTARDACLNTTIDSMLVYFNNGINNSEDHQLQTTNYQLNNYPNPFNPSTTISFELTAKDARDAKIEIYNLKGQKIRKFLIFNNQSSIEWDGTDDNNKQASSGIYFYKLRIGERDIISRKMVLLK